MEKETVDSQADMAALEKEVARLRQEVELLRDLRQSDTARYGRAVREGEWLRHEIRLLNAREREKIEEADETIETNKWQMLPPAIRSLQRQEEKHSNTKIDRFVAAWLLRYARKSARRMDYARAEIFYQAILQLRPRTFLWRQVGNMLAGQGLYSAAIACFDTAIDLAPNDAETHFVAGVALRRLGEKERSEICFRRAIELDEKLAGRPRS